MPTPLELRLHQLSIDFARQIAGIISGMTIEDLVALRGDDGAPKPKPKTRRKPKPAPKPKPKTRRKTKPAPEAVSDQTLASIRVTFPRRGKAGMGAESTVSTPSTEPPPPTPPAPPPPADHSAAFRRAEQERLETAVVKFVSQNPGTDAEIVAVRLGMPKGRTQDALDDLVLKGRLGMKSGQHGRCYVVVE